MKFSTAAFLWTTLAIGIAGVVWFLGDSPEPRSSGPAFAVGYKDGGPSEPQAMVQPSVPTRSVAEPALSIEGFLASYWGTHWSEIRERYLEEGLDLGENLEPGDLLTWDQAEVLVRSEAQSFYERDLPMFRSAFAVKMEQDEEAFFTQFKVSETADRPRLLRELGYALEDLDAELDALGDRYVAGLDAAVQRALVGAPERYPLADLRRKEKEKGDVYRIAVEKGGWFVQYHCKLADGFELERLEAEKGRLVLERMRRIREFMRDLGRFGG